MRTLRSFTIDNNKDLETSIVCEFDKYVTNDRGHIRKRFRWLSGNVIKGESQGTEQ